MVNVTFWGVRGSTPCPSEANVRYGGNTSCVTIEAAGVDPIILDLGTGLRCYGRQVVEELGDDGFRALVLVTHLHWDHVQGLPFFDPVHRPDTDLRILGRGDDGTLADAFGRFMRPPFFPITAVDLIGTVEFEDFVDGETEWGRARITARDVPHTGPTNGYRIEIDGRSIAYISDHQQPADSREVAPSVLELAADVDLLIHDAQYTVEEFGPKSDWGHCTVDYAIEVAKQSGARRLALFHHDPAHDDEDMDRIVADARAMAEGTSIEEVFAGREGLTVSFETRNGSRTAGVAADAETSPRCAAGARI